MGLYMCSSPFCQSTHAQYCFHIKSGQHSSSAPIKLEPCHCSCQICARSRVSFFCKNFFRGNPWCTQHFQGPQFMIYGIIWIFWYSMLLLDPPKWHTAAPGVPSRRYFLAPSSSVIAGMCCCSWHTQNSTH